VRVTVLSLHRWRTILPVGKWGGCLSPLAAPELRDAGVSYCHGVVLACLGQRLGVGGAGGCLVLELAHSMQELPRLGRGGSAPPVLLLYLLTEGASALA
jgi:hypothetical protein